MDKMPAELTASGVVKFSGSRSPGTQSMCSGRSFAASGRVVLPAGAPPTILAASSKLPSRPTAVCPRLCTTSPLQQMAVGSGKRPQVDGEMNRLAIKGKETLSKVMG
jgi:hypothetical protein